MDRLKKYHSILGFSQEITSEELRQLYRKRAKELHPDVNPDPSSHEQFLLLKEAYIFYNTALLKVEENKRAAFVRSKKYPERYFEEKWRHKDRLYYRQRAAELRKKKHEEFRNKGYYKRVERFFFVFDLIKFVQALALVFLLPVFMYTQEHFRGLAISVFVVLITYRIWSRAIARFLRKT